MPPKTSLFLASFVRGFYLQAADMSVCPSGCDCTTVAAGIAAAVSGDRVIVGTPGRLDPEPV